jgi:hypothetical protein
MHAEAGKAIQPAAIPDSRLHHYILTMFNWASLQRFKTHRHTHTLASKRKENSLLPIAQHQTAGPLSKGSSRRFPVKHDYVVVVVKGPNLLLCPYHWLAHRRSPALSAPCVDKGLHFVPL